MKYHYTPIRMAKMKKILKIKEKVKDVVGTRVSILKLRYNHIYPLLEML